MILCASRYNYFVRRFIIPVKENEKKIVKQSFYIRLQSYPPYTFPQFYLWPHLKMKYGDLWLITLKALCLILCASRYNYFVRRFIIPVNENEKKIVKQSFYIRLQSYPPYTFPQFYLWPHLKIVFHMKKKISQPRSWCYDT